MTDEVIHLLARALLHVCSPRRAHAILTRVGQLLPQHRDRNDVIEAAHRLQKHGTCLSRALAVAARADQAELVIGISPRTIGRPFAHAWLELSGLPIDPSDAVGVEIARLGRLRSQSS